MTDYYDLERAQAVAEIPETLAELIGIPYGTWGGKCHEVSKAILDTGRFGPGRMARGWARGVTGQHSWGVLSDDVYDPEAVVVDPTIWHARGHAHKGILVCVQWEIDTHLPHGAGSIWAHSRPAPAEGEPIELTPTSELSLDAKRFLRMLGPLDRRGWAQLANGRMEDWPSREIIAAMDDTPALKALVPIDILGMLTDRNPLGVYLQDLSRFEHVRGQRQ